MIRVIDSSTLESVKPTIVFNVELDTNESSTAMIGVTGWLRSDNGLILAPLQELMTEKTRKESQKLSAKETSFDRSNFVQRTSVVSLVAELDEVIFQRIEEIRRVEPKHQVKLKLDLFVRSLQSKMIMAHFYRINPKSIISKDIPVNTSNRTQNAELMVSAYDPGFYSDSTNGWILSGDNGPTFLEVNVTNLVIPYSINATDWITDYVPKFGLGHKIMLEIPSDGHVFQEATEHLTRAESSFRRWDAKGVFSNCREIGKLLDARVREKLGADSFAYKETWGRAFRFFSHWASLDLHNEEMKQKYPNQKVGAGVSDSEFILLNTKILMKYAQELLTS